MENHLKGVKQYITDSEVESANVASNANSVMVMLTTIKRKRAKEFMEHT